MPSTWLAWVNGRTTFPLSCRAGSSSGWRSPGPSPRRPEVLLCDEPTGALDYKTGKRVLDVIESINRELGTTTAVITHNAAIGGMASRVVSLADGQIAGVQENERRLSTGELSW